MKAHFFALSLQCEINFCIMNLIFCFKYPSIQDRLDRVFFSFFPFHQMTLYSNLMVSFYERIFAMEHLSSWRSFHFVKMAIFRTGGLRLNWVHTIDTYMKVIIIYAFSAHNKTIKSNENGAFKFYFNLNSQGSQT